MELHCLPVETPTGSSCSTDPIYDNCLPHAQSRRTRDSHMERRVQQPTVPRLYGPRPGLAPAVGPTVDGGARGPGLWPDHSYCSWRGVLGRPGYGAELGARGGDTEQGILWRAQDRSPLKRSPSPSHSTEHRSALSFYDNIPEAVTPDNLPVFAMETQEQMYQAWAPQQVQELLEPEEESLERSPWSSCEIVLPESKELDLIPDQDPELCSQVCQTEPWHSEEAPEPVRQPPPVPVADPSASALRSLLTNLQQQITRQREEYEERITSLENRNEELQVEVIRLKTNLAQQRHWYKIVQAKIMESEKARVAAEQRNAALQREMEQFFDTFGELNKEAKKTEYIAKSF
ncbi:hypothetical protein WMY93_009731 [Mugilogobius chulae]|uniref:Rho GTPase-activating protein 24-like n=1 Tax=Mugilogobius chulae TaxID=88201 RepID=A0AAW0PR04_9GOBI